MATTMGQIIKKLRKGRGFTQEELAEKSGVSRTTISNLENDSNKTVNTRTLNKIASALGVKLESLFLR